MIAVPPALTRLLLAVAPEPTSSTPPLLTVVLVTSPPLATSSMPFLMVQWAVLALLTVQVPPTTLKVVKPRYWTPIELRCAGIRYPAAGAAAAEHGGVDEVETLIAGENLAAVGDAAEECGDFLETDAATIRCGDSAGVCYAAAGAAAAQDRDGADENASLLRRDLTAVDDAAQKSARAVNIYPGEFNRDRAAVANAANKDGIILEFHSAGFHRNVAAVVMPPAKSVVPSTWIPELSPLPEIVPLFVMPPLDPWFPNAAT